MRRLLRYYYSKTGRFSSRPSYALRQAARISCITIVLMCLGLVSCTPPSDEKLENAPLSKFQEDLLQRAFDIASAIPVEPHIKSRSTAQKKVVDAAIRLEHPERAASFAEKIENWNRGAAHADLAFFYAEKEVVSRAVEHLEMAEQVIQTLDTWHRDRILSRMAQTLELMGETQAASRVTEGIEEHEAAKIHAARAAKISNEQYQPQMEALQKLFADNNFDLKIRGLQGLSALYGRVYDDPERRSEIETSLRTSVEEFAPIVKIDLFLDLASMAVSHGDPPTALKWVSESRELFENAAWRPRFGIPVAARIAESAFQAGNAALAEQMANAAETTYREQEKEIINIYKADTLIPLAEAFAVSGQTDHALALYNQAVEAAVENPNSRPRAEDLSLIGISMALYKVEPPEELWGRILEIQNDLGDPW